MGDIDDILKIIEDLPSDKLNDIVRSVEQAGVPSWVPNPGPQTMAYYCQADQLLYGGEAGGGKSDLLVGLAYNEHRRSALYRRIKDDTSWLVERMAEVHGSRDGYNSQKSRWNFPDGKVIDFIGLQHPGDEQRAKGRPKDFIGFDEASDFLEDQIIFVLNWLRTTDPEQRTRVVFATNPPRSAEGEWVVRWFAPWVDKSHELYPYEEGKLLWTVRGHDAGLDTDDWVWFPEPYEYKNSDGFTVKSISRTFIRSSLSDNPDLSLFSNYRSQLAQLPEELRRLYEKGDFTAIASDDEYQVIPTEWIRAAQERWTKPPRDMPMTAVGVDVAQGGADRTVIARRYGLWFDELLSFPGTQTPDGASVGALVFKYARDGCHINIDMGGGWGGSAYEHIKDMGLSVTGFVPSAKTYGRTIDGQLGFANRRAEAVWKLREALMPEAEEKVYLPPDPLLRSDLASFRWRLNTGGKIQIEDKSDIKKRIGRSPDYGDAVIISYITGSAMVHNNRRRPHRQTSYLPGSRRRQKRYGKRRR